MRLKPFNDYLIVKPDEDEWVIEKPSLLEIPSEYEGAYKKRPTTGIVVAKGPLCSKDYEVGERVRFPRVDNRQRYIEGDIEYRFVCDYEVEAVIDA